jgi:hypothetical protein
MTRRTTLVGLVAGVLLASLIACGDHGRTDELVTAGKNASTHLQSYYDHLTKTTLDWWEYQTAYNTIQEVTTTQELEQVMTQRLAVLRARATMAGRLADVYDTISRLRNPKSTQPAVAAAQNLGKAMAGLPKLPGGDLSSGLGQAADVLMDLQRDRDFTRANKALTEALTRVRDLFLREEETYRSIARDRDQTRHALLQSLSRKNLINTNPLLDRLRLGVTWTPSDPAVARALALNTDTINIQRLAYSWSCATDETGTILALLVAGHEQLATKVTPAPASLERAQTRATACLADGGQQ